MTVISFASGLWKAPETDLLVVGAGAAGIVLSVALARAGVPVTLVEAGPINPPRDFTRHNLGRSTGRPFARLDTGRMRAYGGTTRLWGGQLVPFDRSDFESQSADGRRLWPISYDEIEPWFDQAYRFLGLSANAIDFAQIYTAASGAAPALSAEIETFLTAWLPQPDFTRLFERDLQNNPCLTVVTDAAVSRLSLDAAGSVSEVELKNPDGLTKVLEPGRVVLAAGTFEIVKILLQTANMHRESAYSANPNIGRWYLDHVNGVIGDIELADRERFVRRFAKIFRDGRKYMVKLRGRGQRREGQANIAVTFLDRYTIRELISDSRQLLRRTALWNRNFFNTLHSIYNALHAIIPFAWHYATTRRAGFFGNRLQIGFELEQLPLPNSFLFLDPAAGGEARMGVQWNIGEDEMISIKSFSEKLKSVLEENGLGQVTLDPRVMAADPAFFDDCQNSGHYMGGARMADSAQRGVVDCNCKVFGTSNLYVAGAAVFPSGSFANSTFSALALTLRLSSHLQGGDG